MAAPPGPKDQFVQSIADVVQGWNEKLSLTDEKLALMVPFCDIYAIFTGEDVPNDAGDKRLIDSGFNVQLKDYSSKTEEVTLVPVFNLLAQQTSTDRDTGKLLKPRGVGGIESCRIATSNPNLGTYRVTAQIEVPSYDEDIKFSRALRRMTIPGTNWLIAYGWTRDSSTTRTFSPIVNKTIDLTSPHKGYYRFLRCQLMRFNWSINTNRVVSGTLEFWPDIKTAGLLATMSVHRKTIKDLLSNKTKLTSSCPVEIRKQLPQDDQGKPKVSIKKKRVVYQNDGSTGRKKVTQEEDGYFYLGWVIEAMRQAMEDPNDPRYFKMILFDSWIDAKKPKVMLNADGDKDSSAITCKSPADVPISVDDLTDVFDNSTNESLLWSIDRVCTIANKNLLSSAEIFVEVGADGKTLLIKDANDVAFTIANRADLLKIGVSTPNSLLQGIELGSRVPIDFTWTFNYFVNTDEGSSVLYNMFEKEASSSKKDSEISETAKLIRKFNRSSIGDKKALDANRLSNWRSYLNVNSKDKIDKITQEVTTSQTVPVGLALRNFFKTVTVHIHGTAMVPPLTQLEILGILPGIDGRYQVFQIEDVVSPGSFSTNLEAALLL